MIIINMHPKPVKHIYFTTYNRKQTFNSFHTFNYNIDQDWYCLSLTIL